MKRIKYLAAVEASSSVTFAFLAPPADGPFSNMGYSQIPVCGCRGGRRAATGSLTDETHEDIFVLFFSGNLEVSTSGHDDDDGSEMTWIRRGFVN